MIAGENIPPREALKKLPVDEISAQRGLEGSLRFFDQETFIRLFSVPRYLRKEAAMTKSSEGLLNAYPKKE